MWNSMSDLMGFNVHHQSTDYMEPKEIPPPLSSTFIKMLTLNY